MIEHSIWATWSTLITADITEGSRALTESVEDRTRPNGQQKTAEVGLQLPMIVGRYEIETAVNSGVLDILAINPTLVLQILFVLSVYVFLDWFPAEWNKKRIIETWDTVDHERTNVMGSFRFSFNIYRPKYKKEAADLAFVWRERFCDDVTLLLHFGDCSSMI